MEAIEALKAAMAEAGGSDYVRLAAMGKPTRPMGTGIAEITSLEANTGQGAPRESIARGVQMAGVEVDTETGEVRDRELPPPRIAGA